jgi:hypothetical protein
LRESIADVTPFRRLNRMLLAMPADTAAAMLTRHDALVEVAERYKATSAENYGRITELAERIRASFCAWFGAMDGPCVFLVPPQGPFETRPYGDAAFSMPAKGLRPIEAIAFGLAIRVTRAGDWLRLPAVATCLGAEISIEIDGGPEHSFAATPDDVALEAFFAAVRDHVVDMLTAAVQRYQEGEYAGGDIGFQTASPRPA